MSPHAFTRALAVTAAGLLALSSAWVLASAALVVALSHSLEVSSSLAAVAAGEACLGGLVLRRRRARTLPRHAPQAWNPETERSTPMSQITRSLAREGKQWMSQFPALSETLDSLQTQLRDIDSRARAVVQERPLTALAAAVALGYLLRRLQPSARR